MYVYPPLKLFVAGKWVERPGAEVVNPADSSVLGVVPHATTEDLSAAVDGAERGFAVWSRTAPAKREEVILAAMALVRSRLEEFAQTITREQGKTIAEARREVLRGSTIYEWDAQEGRRMYGRIIPAEPGMRHMVLRSPIGIVAAFAPWNYPYTSIARKIGGALSAGCSIILKASEETPGTAVLMAKAFQDAGLPDGVLNLVFGSPSHISEYLIAQPSVRLVTFTGSVPVGKRLAALAGEHMKPCIMELGGHGPVIVCADADPVAVAKKSVAAKVGNAGQICTSPTRWFVHEDVHGAFLNNVADLASTVIVGDGLDPSVQMGPVANERRLQAMQRLVADATSKGARLLAGGKRPGMQGYCWPLTVLADVPDNALVMTEEPFGPIAVVNRVKSLDEAIARSNALPFGLAGYAFTDSAQDAARISDDLEVGNLAINHFMANTPEAPFGGVKDSGYAREGGSEGLGHYTVTKHVSHLSA